MKNIYLIGDKYHIIKSHYGHKIDYGCFNTYDEARDKRNLLSRFGWIKNSSTYYPSCEHFHDYHVKHLGKYYFVYDASTKTLYGKYFNMHYALLVSQILPFHENNPNIVLAQNQAINEYYKYIQYDSNSNKYKVTVNNKTISRCNSLSHALQERDLVISCEDDDEETLCNLITFEYNEPHPPFMQLKFNHTFNSYKNKESYVIQKNTKNLKVRIGSYNNKDIAEHIQELLTYNGWDIKYVDYVKLITREVQRKYRNIKKKHNKYFIIYKNKVLYSTYDLSFARFLRTQLEMNDWNIDIIDEMKNYYLENKDNIIEKQSFINNFDCLNNNIHSNISVFIDDDKNVNIVLSETLYGKIEEKFKLN